MGRLKWSEYEYYTSSPEAVYYAFQGYFDERGEQISLMRNVALFASQRSGSDFNKYWPDKVNGSTDTVVMSEEMRKKIVQIHNIKF